MERLPAVKAERVLVLSGSPAKDQVVPLYSAEPVRWRQDELACPAAPPDASEEETALPRLAEDAVSNRLFLREPVWRGRERPGKDDDVEHSGWSVELWSPRVFAAPLEIERLRAGVWEVSVQTGVDSTNGYTRDPGWTGPTHELRAPAFTQRHGRGRHEPDGPTRPRQEFRRYDERRELPARWQLGVSARPALEPDVEPLSSPDDAIVIAVDRHAREPSDQPARRRHLTDRANGLGRPNEETASATTDDQRASGCPGNPVTGDPENAS